MKKLILCIAVSLATAGCKENKAEKEVIVTEVATDSAAMKSEIEKRQDPCIGLSDYRIQKTVDAKAEWLRKNGAKVCQDTLYKYAGSNHNIPAGAALVKLPGNSLTMTWGDIESLTRNFLYDKYVAFDVDASNNIKGLKLISLYDKNIPCYSIPLLRSIAAKYRMKTTDSFEFYHAKVDGKTTIAFQPKVTALPSLNVNHDYSDEPSKDKNKYVTM